MSELIRLCRVEEVSEGAPFAANFPSLPALAVYQIGDEYFVTDNLCTHGNAMLTDGFQDGSAIECPFHGGAFDIRSGAATVFPCQVALRTYTVEIDDDWIAIRAPAGGEA